MIYQVRPIGIHYESRLPVHFLQVGTSECYVAGRCLGKNSSGSEAYHRLNGKEWTFFLGEDEGTLMDIVSCGLIMMFNLCMLGGIFLKKTSPSVGVEDGWSAPILMTHKR